MRNAAAPRFCPFAVPAGQAEAPCTRLARPAIACGRRAPPSLRPGKACLVVALGRLAVLRVDLVLAAAGLVGDDLDAARVL